MNELAEIVAHLARTMPHSLLEPLSRGLQSGGFRQRNEWAALATSPATRSALLLAFDKWQACAPKPDAAALGFGLRVALENERWRKGNPSAELVWSGPKIAGFDWRQTEAALLQIIESAQTSLWLVTFAAYRIPYLANALEAAVSRGVAVHFVAETSADSDGRLSFDAANVLNDVSFAAHIYHWPREKRLADGTRLGVLHAKCAVADGRVALVSSANLTDNALHLNIEIGALLHGEAAARLQNHLEDLVAHEVIQAQL